MFSKMRSPNQSTRRTKPQARQTTSKRTNQGIFLNSVWYCNCEPKLPAEHFQVKKQGKNKGRWFYTCQKDPEERCKFFLWGEEAMTREKETVLKNTRSEKPQATRKMRGILDGISLRDELALAQTMPDFDEDETESEAEQVDTPSRIRNLPFTSERGQSFASDGLRKNLFQRNTTLDKPSTTMDTQAQAIETPKLDRAITAYATPAETIDRKRVLPWDVPKMSTNNKKDIEEEMETPSKKAKLDTSMQFNNDDIAMPSIHRGIPIAATDDDVPVATNTRPVSNHVVAATTVQQVRPLTPAQKESVVIPETPAPVRFKDAVPPPATTNFNLFAAIETELATCDVPQAVMSKIRQHIKRQEMIAMGVQKARDLLRKERKSFQEQIAAFQAQSETNKLSTED